MESLFDRYRNLVVLLVLLLAQIVGLAVQVHRTDSGHMSLDPRDSQSVRLIRLWANALVSPPERIAHFFGGSVVFVWENYFDLRRARAENRDLQKTIDRLRLEQAALLEDARQGERLQAMLGFEEKYIYTTLPAQVIGSSGTEQSRVVYIDKGKNAGLDHDMAVITADGIVGKVRDVFPHTSQVLLINDQTSGAGVILATTRIRGILRGNAQGQAQVVGLMADSRIQPGEPVLTAGGDEIFPRGLPVGAVAKVLRDPEQDGFIDVIVKPAAHIDRLDEVLVIISTQPRFPPEQKQDMTTSMDLKGAEVEQEKAQKRASEVLAERLPGLIDPNLPADKQPLNDDSNPNPVSRPPMSLHPDRFTPGSSFQTGVDQAENASPQVPASNTTSSKPAKKAAPASKDAPDAAPKEKPDTEPAPPAQTPAPPAPPQRMP